MSTADEIKTEAMVKKYGVKSKPNKKTAHNGTADTGNTSEAQWITKMAKEEDGADVRAGSNSCKFSSQHHLGPCAYCGEGTAPVIAEDAAEKIVRHMAESAVRWTIMRNDFDLIGMGLTEDQLVDDAIALALGEDIGCLDREDMSPDTVAVLFARKAIADEKRGEIQELKRQLAEAQEEILGKITCNRCRGLLGKHEVFCPVNLYNADIALKLSRLSQVNGKLVEALLVARTYVQEYIDQWSAREMPSIVEAVRNHRDMIDAALAEATNPIPKEP